MPTAEETQGVIKVHHSLLRRQVDLILTAWGLPADDRDLVSAAIVETDLRAIDSHGVSMLPLYDEMRLQGRLNVCARPRVLHEQGATVLIDADAGLGHAVSVRAMRRAADLSRTFGCSVVGVRNSHHFGAAGIYAEVAAEMGVIGLVATSTRFITMVPTFGAEPVLGTNPLAFAAPGDREAPVILDMATTSVAGNKVRAYWLNDRAIPEGWVVDGSGHPVTDASLAREIVFERPEGGLTPLGGTPEGGSHKGYGLALMVHVLAGVLTGGSFSPIRNRTQGETEPDNIGHLFLAIDPRAFRAPGDFERDLDAVVKVLRATRPSDPQRPVLVPGDPERNARAERIATGIPLPPRLQEQLRAITLSAGVEYLLGGPV